MCLFVFAVSSVVCNAHSCSSSSSVTAGICCHIGNRINPSCALAVAFGSQLEMELIHDDDIVGGNAVTQATVRFVAPSNLAALSINLKPKDISYRGFLRS